MKVSLLLLALALSACSAGNRPPAGSPASPAAGSPTSSAAPVEAREAAEPVLPAPWADVDFRASDAELEKRFAAMKTPDCKRGWFQSNGLCWGTNDRTGDQTITIYLDSAERAQQFTQGWGTPAFAGTTDDETWRTWHLRAGTRRIEATLIETASIRTIVLEQMMPLREAIPWLQSLVGLDHDAVTRQLGKRGAHHQTECEGILCFYVLPPTEAGDMIGAGSVEFARGVAVKATYSMWCDDDCATLPAILAAFDAAFGARETTSRPYEATGELWTYHRYASTPGLVVKSRDYLPDTVFVCVGACD